MKSRFSRLTRIFPILALFVVAIIPFPKPSPTIPARIFIPAGNNNDNVLLFEGVAMNDNMGGFVYSQFSVPRDYVSGMTVKTVVTADDGSGNVYAYSDVSLGSLGESPTARSYVSEYSAVPVSTNISEIKPIVVSDVSPDDYVRLRFIRDAQNPNDTLDAGILFVAGFLVEYKARR